MSRIEDIENEIRQLSPDELATFRDWFLQFDAELWDRQIETDVRAGKLNKIADAALKSHRKGESSEI
jgi:hypothetical protein